MIKKFNLFFITLFNIGKIKFAPGTFASLITCLIFLFLIDQFSALILLFCTLFIFFYSFIAINNTPDEFKSDDPNEIVIDEAVGQMLPLLAIPVYEILYVVPVEYYCIAAFLLFRLFDIWKPYPIGYIDSNVKGALGIMLDDIIAGLYSIIILILASYLIGG